MDLETKQIHFDGFTPSDICKQNINLTMSKILDEAPAGGILRVIITKNNNLYSGNLWVNSRAGNFSAVSTSSEVHEVSKSLLMDMRTQFDIWKAKRFQEEEPYTLRKVGP